MSVVNAPWDRPADTAIFGPAASVHRQFTATLPSACPTAMPETMMRLALVPAFVLTTLATPTFAAPDPACLAEIRTLLQGLMQAGPYAMEIEVDSPYGDSAVVMEIVPPLGMHSHSITGDTTSEMVVLDGKGWMAFDGVWQEMTPDLVAGMSALFDGSAIDTIGASGDAACLGPVVLGGRQAIGFRYGISSGQSIATSYYYIDPKTRLPLEMMSETPAEAGTITVTSTYRFDPTITITPPKF
jgi:hypothetical protein